VIAILLGAILLVIYCLRWDISISSARRDSKVARRHQRETAVIPITHHAANIWR